MLDTRLSLTSSIFNLEYKVKSLEVMEKSLVSEQREKEKPETLASRTKDATGTYLFYYRMCQMNCIGNHPIRVFSTR